MVKSGPKPKNKRKIKHPKNIFKETALELPRVEPKQIFLYAIEKRNGFFQEQLEKRLLIDTPFEEALFSLRKKAKQYNIRQYSKFITCKILEFTTRGLLTIDYLSINGNAKKTKQRVRVTEKGVAFYEYLRKHKFRSICGTKPFHLYKKLNQFRRHRFRCKALKKILYLLLGLIIATGFFVVLVYFSYQLEGIVWNRQNNTIAVADLNKNLFCELISTVFQAHLIVWHGFL